MAYFNHAFTKLFLGTGSSLISGPIRSVDGFVTTTGTTSAQLSTLAPGYYMFVNPKTWARVDAPANCCPLVLVSSSLLQKDKLGPSYSHGGYKETNKSKLINPKYVHKWYRVDPCTPQQSVISIGNTPYTEGGANTLSLPSLGTETFVPGVYTIYLNTLTGTGSGIQATVTVNALGVITTIAIIAPGGGYALGNQLGFTNLPVASAGTPVIVTVTGAGSSDPKCCFEFICGETYYLRIDIKGSPVLRFENHNAYQNVYAYTGCCPDSLPTAIVDSTLVMIAWAQMILENQYLTPFVFPVVYTENQVPLFPPNSTVDPQGNPITPAQWWSTYISPGHTVGNCAGLRLFGAYVETKFGNCTFQVTDFFEKAPVRLYASLVDLTGDPCVFEGICVYQECRGVQGMGFGEEVVRDLILSESYLQNFFHSGDFRIREVTQGYDILNAVNRNALYTRYFLLHTVPRFNNPTGVFDNDQYMLEIITNLPNPTLEQYIDTWLGTCPDCVAFEIDSCNPCVITPAQ